MAIEAYQLLHETLVRGRGVRLAYAPADRKGARGRVASLGGDGCGVGCGARGAITGDANL